MKPVRMYTSGYCPYCTMAKRLLSAKGVSQVLEILIDTDPSKRQEMMAATGRRTVPQIYVGEVHVGGFDELAALERQGKLDPLLAD